MDKCMFYYGNNFCKILKIQECDGCKFRKTEQQYNEAQKHSDEILAAKGLQRRLFSKDGVQYISVRRIKK